MVHCSKNVVVFEKSSSFFAEQNSASLRRIKPPLRSPCDTASGELYYFFSLLEPGFRLYGSSGAVFRFS
jgi:hypothetical protein